MSGPYAVSVIMPAYNVGNTIAESLNSVWEQTYQPGEVIVIDDGSTDGTTALLTGLDDRIRYQWQANAGPSAARNRGLTLAAGDLIAFLDADDLWLPKSLEMLVTSLVADPAVAIVRGRIRDMWPRVSETEDPVLGEPVRSFNLGNAVYRREVFTTLGGFDAGMRTGEDIDFWVRATERFVIRTIDDVTLLYRRKLVDRIDARRTHFRNLARTLKRSIERTGGRRP